MCLIKAIIHELQIEGRDTPFRPVHVNLSHDTENSPQSEDIKLMELCWQERPEDRPYVTGLKRMLAKTQKGR